MKLRRLFWLGAAVLFSIAALVAIAAVLACVDRGVLGPVGWVAVTLGIASFAVWAGAVWQEDAGTTYWKLAAVLGAWTLAALVVTTLRLLASSRRLLGSLVPATWAAAVLATAIGTIMILRESGDAWQLVVVLVILTVLGYALTPILQRYWAAADTAAPAERLLGTVAGVDVVAVRGDGRLLLIGESSVRVEPGESIVVRPTG